MKINVRFQESETFYAGFREDETFRTNFGSIQTLTIADYETLIHKPSINGVTIIGDMTSEDLGIAASFPGEGNVGDILMKIGADSDAVAWVTPASDVEEDNTRPITSAAVYTEIGNINALLETI